MSLFFIAYIPLHYTEQFVVVVTTDTSIGKATNARYFQIGRTWSLL